VRLVAGVRGDDHGFLSRIVTPLLDEHNRFFPGPPRSSGHRFAPRRSMSEVQFAATIRRPDTCSAVIRT
jgi:hypothetical protein